MKKLISFTVPCYNSQDYMKKCIDSILSGGEDVEIIIVNDGSTDDTLNIANEYAAKYPTIVKVIDKENGGHGSGLNVGIANATGLYFKVVDSDDWLDGDAYMVVLAKIKEHIAANTLPDLYITNFVTEHVVDNTQFVNDFNKKFKPNEITTWDKVKRFHTSEFLWMHALLYKREILVKSGIKLPEHTFYVDNIYDYIPLYHTRTLCYLNVDWYRYLVGRADQSVTITNLVKRYKQYILVYHCMADAYTYDQLKKLPRGLKRYLKHVLKAIIMNVMLTTCAEDSPERRAAYKEFWKHIKQRDIKLYHKLKYRSYTTLVVFLPWKLRGSIEFLGYKILCKKQKIG
jgi:glycosyltransferase involved in cell wall biosynthesis